MFLSADAHQLFFWVDLRPKKSREFPGLYYLNHALPYALEARYEVSILEVVTPPKFNIAPEKWWLENYFPIGKVTFQGLC